MKPIHTQEETLSYLATIKSSLCYEAATCEDLHNAEGAALLLEAADAIRAIVRRGYQTLETRP